MNRYDFYSENYARNYRWLDLEELLIYEIVILFLRVRCKLANKSDRYIGYERISRL